MLPIHNESKAACSPGIPCTDYDIYSNPSAGTDPALNGPKTGAPAPHTDSACDGNFMNQIYSRAFMEASREVIMAEQMIHKPDSVLEYTCFDKHVSNLAENGASFSESQDWDSLEVELWAEDNDSDTTMNDTGAGSLPDQQDYSVFEDTRMDNILEQFILPSLDDYITNNFDHTFLGNASTLDNDMDNTSIGDGDFSSCSHMASVWNIAKCIDFGEDDRYRTFDHFVNEDPRIIPEACSPGFESSDVTGYEVENDSPGLHMITGETYSTVGDLSDRCPPAGTPVAGVNTGFSNDLIRTARNCDVGANPNAYSSLDLVESYTDLIKGFGLQVPGVGTSTGIILCGDPVPTGLPIITYEIDAAIDNPPLAIDVTRTYWIHNEHFCINPSCFYQPVKVPYAWGVVSPYNSTYQSLLEAAPGFCLPRL